MGLAYLNIVRSKDEIFPVVEEIFNGMEGAIAVENWVTESEMRERNSWKEWATTRWREEWQTFLSLDQSRSEPGYEQIKNIYNAVMNSSGKRAKTRGRRKFSDDFRWRVQVNTHNRLCMTYIPYITLAYMLPGRRMQLRTTSCQSTHRVFRTYAESYCMSKLDGAKSPLSRKTPPSNSPSSFARCRCCRY